MARLHFGFVTPVFPSILSSRSSSPVSKALLVGITLIGAICGCASDAASVTQTAQAALTNEKGIAVYAAGDIADCQNMKPRSSGAARTADLIAGRLAVEPDAVVLTLGDATYPVGRPEEFTNCYEPTWGRFKARTFPSPGNHEYYTPEAVGYYRYFGDAAGPERRGYYSFEIGKWHVISLNSNLKPAELRVQFDWLKTDLAQHKARCTLAYWHHPLYSSGGHGNNAFMQEAWQLLMDAGADLVLASHDHDYERFAPQDAQGRRDDQRGMREFVVGTGGARLTPFRFTKDNSEISNNYTFGVLRLLLKDSGYEWEFLPTKDGEINDRGAALCH
jgi:acid phosphatase type 7